MIPRRPGDTEVRVPELALDPDERDAFVCHLTDPPLRFAGRGVGRSGFGPDGVGLADRRGSGHGGSRWGPPRSWPVLGVLGLLGD